MLSETHDGLEVSSPLSSAESQPTTMAPPPSRTLEINLISAQDLAPVSKNMKTYAIAWVQQDRKLATGVDQIGGTNPTWNHKLEFQVDDKFLNSEDTVIFVEIYAAAWVKDVVIGQVKVFIKDVFILHFAADTTAINNNATTKTIALQIHRPSGRPQGVLNMEVSLDGTPLLSQKLENHEKMNHFGIDRIDLTAEDNFGSIINGDSLCSSDVGPSASVVAAAIAKGLYKPPVNNQAQSKETSTILKEWTEKEREIHLERRLERWRSDIQSPTTGYRKRRLGRERRSRRRRGTGNNKLFSCFSKAFGFEISITCGGGKKKYHGDNKVSHLSSVCDILNSQSVV